MDGRRSEPPVATGEIIAFPREHANRPALLEDEMPWQRADLCHLWHPIWRVIAGSARVNKGAVIGVLAVLMADGGRAGRLIARIIAPDLGWATDRVERVLVESERIGVTIRGVVAPEWCR